MRGCSDSDWTVFGQLPAWHDALPAQLCGCWPALLQVCADRSNLEAGAAAGGWHSDVLVGRCLPTVVGWFMRSIPVQHCKVTAFGNLVSHGVFFFPSSLSRIWFALAVSDEQKSTGFLKFLCSTSFEPGLTIPQFGIDSLHACTLS